MKIDLLVSFSVTHEIDVNAIDEKTSSILIDGETVLFAYSHTRDKVYFTSKRIIAVDVQGLTGLRKEYRSFPYSKISSFSVESSGLFDSDNDFKIWVSGVGVFGIKFGERLDIRIISKLLAEKTL